MADIKDVAVVMCTYNGGKYLEEQINSILNQSYPVSEIFVQDDNSTDDTVIILKKYAQLYPFFRYKVNDKQLGINENFFSAFENINSTYIAISDQDDIWHPDKIEKEISVIGDNLLCFCRTKPFSEDSSSIYVDKRKPNFGLTRLIFVNVVPGHTILFKRELLELLPNIKEYYSLGFYDTLLALSASIYGKLCFCDDFLCLYRRHVNAATLTTSHNYEKNILNVLKIFFSSINLLFKYRKIVKEHYSLLFVYMAAHKPIRNLHTYNASLYFVNLIADSSLLSLCKASLWCLKHRNSIFYNEKSDSISLYGRALFFPIMMYQYWDYLE